MAAKSQTVITPFSRLQYLYWPSANPEIECLMKDGNAGKYAQGLLRDLEKYMGEPEKLEKTQVNSPSQTLFSLNFIAPGRLPNPRN